MTTQDALTVLKSITIFYHNFTISEEKAKEWVGVLKDYDFMTVTKTLRDYVKANRFPPTLADLLVTQVTEEKENVKRLAYVQTTDEVLAQREAEAKRLLEQLEGKRP